MAAARKPTHTCRRLGLLCALSASISNDAFPASSASSFLMVKPKQTWVLQVHHPAWTKVLWCSPNDEILAKAAAVKHIPIAKLDNWGPVHGNTNHQTSSSQYTCRISWRKLKDTRSIWVFISLDNSVVSSHGRPSRKATIALQLTNTAKMIRSSRTYGRAYQKPRGKTELLLPSKVQIKTFCAESWEVPFECHALTFFGQWQQSVHVSFSESSWSCGLLGPRAISIHISNLTVPGKLAAWKHCHGLDWHPQSHLSWEHLVSISLGISRERWNFIGIPTEIANVFCSICSSQRTYSAIICPLAHPNLKHSATIKGEHFQRQCCMHFCSVWRRMPLGTKLLDSPAILPLILPRHCSTKSCTTALSKAEALSPCNLISKSQWFQHDWRTLP